VHDRRRPRPSALQREFEKLTGFALHETYGTTESGCITINPRHGVNKAGSIGPLGPGYMAEIRDENGHSLPSGTPGSLWVKSSTTTTGYWDDADATAQAFDDDGWIHTGDVMSVDADGYLWFHGRATQIIVHDGSNVSPQEIEGVLLEHPAVESAGVVGVPDALHGENVCAYVVVHDGAARPRVDELIAFARERVGYKAPAEIVFIEAMPVTPAGKVDRPALRWEA
jgi:long-chain acyl-CoA synthetase